MAATDQNYRNQYMLDIVFAVSSILLLVFIAVMLAVEQGYMSLGEANNKRWKEEQRQFRDVEMAMAQREAINKMPSKAEFDQLKNKVDQEKANRQKNQSTIDDYDKQIRAKLPAKEKADLELQNYKALLDSKRSFYDIAVEHAKSAQAPEVVNYKKEVEDLERNVADAKDKSDRLLLEIKELQDRKDNLERPLTAAVGNLKKLTDDFYRQVNLAIKKRWTAADWFRSLPVIDGFASPTKIEQITINDITIDYNFKGVTRFDRCITCHKGIDRPTFTRGNLDALRYDIAGDAELTKHIKEAHYIIEECKKLYAGMDEERFIPDPNQLKVTPLSTTKLTNARISEFCAHPRMELFVGPTSKHPQEKFGCTSCHAGQPSATSFALAAHTPNDATTKKLWTKEHGWEAQHDWDFPMLPHRFVESSCLKCHYQVADLYSGSDKSEAPKLTRGHGIIREFGCFGCHEINGYKGGRQVGPDMRLEPHPPLESLSEADRAKLMSDVDNPPGTLRKVGPSLFRVSEKTYEEWAKKWLLAPREFRPDTKMPHYYGLSNNDERALAGTGQEKFPQTEIAGIVHYLFGASRDYLDQLDDAHDPKRIETYKKILGELQSKVDAKQPLSDTQTKQYQEAKHYQALAAQPQRLSEDVLKTKGDASNGRDLFTKKGCLACHSHASTNESDGTWPAAPSEAEFGPNLTQVKQKLVNIYAKESKDTKDSEKRARVWLINWLLNPFIHSPRTRMPITHLTPQDAADIAEWLLAQDVKADPRTGKVSEDIQGEKWPRMEVPEPTEDMLRDLAKVYLTRMLADSELEKFFKAGQYSPERTKDLGGDERELAEKLTDANLKRVMEKRKIDEKEARREQLLWFVGRKAIGRLGCYACHDIPGYENAKPIGTGLADWGKKDPGRLAFEDIDNFMKDHFKENQIVDKLVNEDGQPLSVKRGPLYEKFYYEALLHQSREGYLNQKIYEPRSYDYNRIRAWDDRSRMPQFKFARTRKKLPEDPEAFRIRKDYTEAVSPGTKSLKERGPESHDEYAARKNKEEADSREAVMTFVLGLVADPIPLLYVNNPGPDRLAEIKGKQVLDKFNCASCHLVRAGQIEFKLTPAVIKRLDNTWNPDSYKTDYKFHNHAAWTEPKVFTTKVVTHGAGPSLEIDAKKPVLKFTLTEAMQYRGEGRDKDGKVIGPQDHDFRAGSELKIPAGDIIWPPAEAFKSTDHYAAWERQYGQQGGAFGRLLGSYLISEKYPVKDVKGKEFGMVPPVLLWEGERVQPDWLYQFLLDPYKVREMTVLRMPKFNMSDDEAKALVNYFAAVDKRDNPQYGLTYPYVKTPQRSDLTTDYWVKKTKEYIDKMDQSKEGLDSQRKAYEASWAKMREDWEAESTNAKKRFKAALVELRKFVKEEQEIKDIKDDKEREARLAKLKAEKEPVEADFNRLSGEKDRIENLLKDKTIGNLKEDWAKNEAYALGGYRLIVNKCNQCHEIGHLQAQNQAFKDPKAMQVQGPSLNLASKRLQPGWVEHWVANPQRFVPYPTLMPVNFAADKSTAGVAWMPNEPLFMVDAARDTVLNLPTITAYPLTRYWIQVGEGDSSKKK